VAGKREAREVVERAEAGEAFGKLVLAYSLDASTRQRKGDLGTIARDDLAAGYADAAFEAREGTVFGPVRTRHGWNVGQVAGIIPATELPFDQVKDRIRESLRSQKVLAAWRAWLAAQITAADVEYAADYRPVDPDAPPPGPASPLVPGVDPSPSGRQPR